MEIIGDAFAQGIVPGIVIAVVYVVEKIISSRKNIENMEQNALKISTTDAEEKIYIQVTESMNDDRTRERELAPLRMVRDNHEKIVIAGNCDNPTTKDGIKIIMLTDFLLQ